MIEDTHTILNVIVAIGGILSIFNTYMKAFEYAKSFVSSIQKSTPVKYIAKHRLTKAAKKASDVALILLPLCVLVFDCIYFKSNFITILSVCFASCSLVGALLLTTKSLINKINFSDKSSKLFMSGNYT